MKRKTLLMIMILLVFFLSISHPVYTLAEVDPGKKNGESLYRGDDEIKKSGEEIREETDVESEELDTHGLKDIKEGKKEFYNEYSDEFDELEENVPGASIFVDLIKDFDYVSGNFDCGKFDILCHIVNFIFVTGTSIINFLVAPLGKLAIEPEKIIDDATFTKFNNNFNSFTTSLLAVFLIFQIMKIYVFRLTNHNDTVSVLNEKIVKVFIAGIFLFSYEYFFQLILTIQYRVNYGIFSYVSNTNEITTNMMLNLLLTPNGIMFVFMVLAYAILLAILFFQMTYTFALIGLFYVVGPVAVVTMVNDEYNMFTMWLRTIIARFVTLSAQGLCVILSFSYATKIDWIFSMDPMENAFSKIIALSFLIVGITLPGLLKDFGNSSGSARGAISATQSVTRVFTRR